MAASHVTGHAASQEAIALLQKVVLNILDDEGFTLPTDECKRSLELANSLAELCRQASSSCCSHAKWLVDKLDKLILNTRKRGSTLISKEKLWNTYHKLRTSTAFEQTWEKFLDKHKLTSEPLLYQHITDKAFELLIRKNVPSESSGRCEQSEEQEKLSFDEENALRYVGGFVIRQLLEKTKDRDIQHVLGELKDEGATTSEGPAQEWVNSIDRGGLTRITTEAFRCFYAIEMCARRHLSTDNPEILGNI